ncbi:MAG: uroporphyrinogen decarboxylase family protein [Clostridium sp.]
MEDLYIYKCVSDDLDSIPKSVVDKLSVGFPEVHKTREGLITLSKEFKSFSKDKFCRLPFCSTVEAESLGASINYGNKDFGPRVLKRAFENLEDLRDNLKFDLNKGRISEVLRTVEDLKGSGEKVILNVSGPLTILDSLIESRIIFKALRKEPEIVEEILVKLENFIVEYIRKAMDVGADIISFADPLGNVDIMGEKVYCKLSGIPSRNILNGIHPYSKGKIIHLCGKNTYSLYKCKLTNMEKLYVDEFISEDGCTYGDILNNLINKDEINPIIGNYCVKKTTFEMKKNYIWKIEFI